MTPAKNKPTKRRSKYLREYKRNYMRRWRAVPANKQREKIAQRRYELTRKERILNSRGQLCTFCCLQASTEVERLVPTRIGFRRIVVPYCGQC
jgi:hypothetical protein